MSRACTGPDKGSSFLSHSLTILVRASRNFIQVISLDLRVDRFQRKV